MRRPLYKNYILLSSELFNFTRMCNTSMDFSIVPLRSLTKNIVEYTCVQIYTLVLLRCTQASFAGPDARRSRLRYSHWPYKYEHDFSWQNLKNNYTDLNNSNNINHATIMLIINTIVQEINVCTSIRNVVTLVTWHNAHYVKHAKPANTILNLASLFRQMGQTLNRILV